MSQDHFGIILKRDKDSPVPARSRLQNDTSVTCRIRNPGVATGSTLTETKAFIIRKYRAIRRPIQNLKKPGIEYSDFESPPSPRPVSRVLFASPFIVEWNEVFTRAISRSFSTVPIFVPVLFLELLRRAAHTRGAHSTEDEP